jgi:uroporphyrinogen III methyltransferase / synthase
VTVYLVGAGPGDPGLLTVRGAELLARADVVVHDRLVHASLLDRVRPDAELVYVGRSAGHAALGQTETSALLVDRGRRGLEVVRLKGGDPYLFGRGGEEAEELRAAGVPFEVVPGVTSAIAAAAYAGVPVTHRGLSTHVTIVTGHEDPTKDTASVDWEALGALGGTLVVMMGVGRLPEITARLQAGGRPPDTPVTSVTWGTTTRQRTVRATLATIARADLEAPAAIVIGDVAALDLAWFETRPLFGRTIVVTRARDQASTLRQALEALGAEVLELPTIAVEPVPFGVPPLDRYAWVVFTSANAVERFVDAGMAAAGLDARAFAGCGVAAIGPATAGALEARGVRADLVPERSVAEGLLEVFPTAGHTAATPATAHLDRPSRLLLPRAEVGRDVLPDGLWRLGWEVEILPVYRTVRGTPPPAVLDRVRRGDVDAVTFTSASTVTGYAELLGTLPDPHPLVASIGPATSDEADRHLLDVDVEASPHTIDGLVAALVARLGAAPEGPGTVHA